MTAAPRPASRLATAFLAFSLIALILPIPTALGASEETTYEAPYTDAWVCPDAGSYSVKAGSSFAVAATGLATAHAATGRARAGIAQELVLREAAPRVRYSAEVTITEALVSQPGARASVVLEIHSQEAGARHVLYPSPLPLSCFTASFGAASVPVAGPGAVRIEFVHAPLNGLIPAGTYRIHVGVEAATTNGNVYVMPTVYPSACLNFGFRDVPGLLRYVGSCVQPPPMPGPLSPQGASLTGVVNKVSARVEDPFALPDLTVSSVSMSPAKPTAYEPVDYSVRVQNLGTAASPPSEITMDTWGYGPYPVAQVPALQPGESTTVTLTFPAEDGYNRASFRVDGANQIVEGREDNNHLSVYYELYADLVIEGATLQPSNPAPGESVQFTARIKNQGPGQRGPGKGYVNEFPVWFRVGADGWSANVAPLLPGASADVSVCCWTAKAGAHAVVVEADPGYPIWGHAIAESNEFNNVHAEPFLVVPGGQPDLVVEALSATPANPTEGDALALAATIKNLGTANAGASHVRFLVDGQTAGPDVALEALGPGQSKTVTTSWTSVRGTHAIKAIADARNQVPESNEANDERQTTIHVQEPPRYGASLAPASQTRTVPAKSTTTYDVTLTNTGNRADTFDLTQAGSRNGWSSTLSPASATLEPGASTTVRLTVEAGTKGSLTVTITAKSRADPSATAQASATTKLS